MFSDSGWSARAHGRHLQEQTTDSDRVWHQLPLDTGHQTDPGGAHPAAGDGGAVLRLPRQKHTHLQGRRLLLHLTIR